jgi:hypothetical protein
MKPSVKHKLYLAGSVILLLGFYVGALFAFRDREYFGVYFCTVLLGVGIWAVARWLLGAKD